MDEPIYESAPELVPRLGSRERRNCMWFHINVLTANKLLAHATIQQLLKNARRWPNPCLWPVGGVEIRGTTSDMFIETSLCDNDNLRFIILESSLSCSSIVQFHAHRKAYGRCFVFDKEVKISHFYFFYFKGEFPTRKNQEGNWYPVRRK